MAVASHLSSRSTVPVIEPPHQVLTMDATMAANEVERGRKADRPEFAKALHLAKVTGATLVIAKLDRLSRNAAFLLALRDSGVRFVAVDMPEANDLTVGVMALVAQAEREAISRRTKEALAVPKIRGVNLGNPNGAESLRRAGKGGAALRATVSANAAAFAADLAPVLADIRAGRHTSLRAIAAELTAREIRTRWAGTWESGMLSVCCVVCNAANEPLTLATDINCVVVGFHRGTVLPSNRRTMALTLTR
jgi:DNA invertase Pin-like site-specific DNA recombinase